MMNLFRKTAAGVLALILLTGCAGLKNMQKNAGLIRFKAIPDVLETHAGKVEVAVNGVLPPKYFDKKATMEVSPVLTYEGGEHKLTTVNLQGEKVPANNKVISYDGGGSFNLNEKFDFNEAMRLSDLVIRMEVQRGKKSVTFDPVKIGKGILATSTLVATLPKPILGIRREANTTGVYDPSIDPFQRIVPDEMIADIAYLINSYDLRPQEKNSEDVKKYIDYTRDAGNDSRKEVKKVEITASASPEGALDFNTKLASKREKVSTAFIEKELEQSSVLEKLRTRYTPEDWDGFKQEMERSNIQDKELILRVLTMYSDPEVREREIRNLSATFTQIAEEVLPKLRRAKMVTSINLIGKTDEEILALAESNPASLNPAELLYAATLTNDPAKKLKIYQSFAQVYPSDWRGHNNTGFVLAQQFKYAEAKPWFEKASQLNCSEPIIKNNMGTIALIENDLKKAEELFGTAAGLGDEVNYNLGLINIKKGDYNRANQYFGNMADPNTALAKLLSDNFNGALRDLEQFEKPECTMKEYLKAIIGARTNDDKLFFDSLRNAMKFNPEWKAKARTDMEFEKYFGNLEFKEITK